MTTLAETTLSEEVLGGETAATKVEVSQKTRYLSIDVIRGLAIAIMIVVNTIIQFDNTPWWSKHAYDYGFNFIDLGPPLFIFAITLSYTFSFKRYLKANGYLKTYIRYLRRYGAFFGFGVIGGWYLVTDEGIKFSWGVLQAIGIGGIFTLIFIGFPRIVRLVVSLSGLTAYHFIQGISVEVGNTLMTLSDLSWNDRHGGIIGGIGYCLLMLLSTAIIDDFQKTDKRQILIFGLLLTISGTVLHFVWKATGKPFYGGLSKERVTIPYILLSLGLSIMLFLIIWYVYDKEKLTKNRSRILQPFGRNPFFFYIIHPLFILFSTLYLNKDAHLALVILSGLLNLVVLWVAAYFMNKYQIYITI